MKLVDNHEKPFEAEFQVLAACGITNITHYLEKMNEDSIGADLEMNTSEALDTGAFGAPWIVVHKNGERHAFFGSDRLHLIAHLIGENFTDGLQKYSKL
ncbi:unnamed protein product [Heligmosomoides polygyrus]|uniref:DSBA domain-containing protein n=1 Tax=Heligmosomoides polygyrus TaxID=6339 RepID=A0A183GIU4_HELPZ|nr:unnamed protein product [Heligmosomoides polygyrus]